MTEKVTLEWNYKPKRLFEEPFEHCGDGYTLTIDMGKAVAEFSDEANKPPFQDVHDELESLFRGALLETDKTYVLSQYVEIHTRPNGTHEKRVRVGGAVVMEGRLDAVVRDAQGNIKGDARAEGISRLHEWARLNAKHRDDPTFASLSKSYEAARRDPDNALVHLYEILDALKERFGSVRIAWKTLGIAKGDWDRLGRLANYEPLRQGRHRGAKVGKLRDATPAERKEAHTVAKKMIYAYRDYLQNGH